jgi:hypothetical protein
MALTKSSSADSDYSTPQNEAEQHSQHASVAVPFLLDGPLCGTMRVWVREVVGCVINIPPSLAALGF